MQRGYQQSYPVAYARLRAKRSPVGSMTSPAIGVALPSFRGDFVNAPEPEFTQVARMPELRRRIRGTARSAMTMNFVRSRIDGGFADLHQHSARA